MKRSVKVYWKQQRFWIFLGIAFLVAGMAGLGLNYIASSEFSCSNGEKIAFEDGHGITHDEAGQLYNEAGEALKTDKPEDALEIYKKIEKPYKGLNSLVLIHKSDAYAAMGNETEAQNILKKLVKKEEGSSSGYLAQYKLGQSYLRAGQNDLAKDIFIRIVQESPSSNLALGSHYYLGEIADRDGDVESALLGWRSYLRSSLDGTFSLVAAKGLNRLPVPKTAEDYQLIGFVLHNQGNWEDAIFNLKKGDFEKVWLELGKSLIKTGNIEDGIKTLEKGLHSNTSPDRAEDAIKTIVDLMPSSVEKKAKLKHLLATNPKTGNDYILWQLQQLSTDTEKSMYGEQLLSKYPASNWGPETSWALMWPFYLKGNMGEFLKRAYIHLNRYPASISAPRVMYWKANIYRKDGKTAIMRGILQTLKDKYPYQYYAFRAEQILNGTSNPWGTSVNMDYPAAGDNGFIKPEALSQYITDPSLKDIATELLTINNTDDLLFVSQALPSGELPPPLQSIVLYQQKDYANSIKVIRDYLDKKRKQGTPSKDTELLKLLYPLVYTDEIKQYSHANRLDPWLVQALTRQESYFNHMAISSSHAMGLMQLLPSTAQAVAKWENIEDFKPAALFNPDINIRLGSRYLAYLHEKFNGNSFQAVGGYNGGPGAMGRWSKASLYLPADPDMFIETIPYQESRQYIKEVFSHYWNYRSLYTD